MVGSGNAWLGPLLKTVCQSLGTPQALFQIYFIFSKNFLDYKGWSEQYAKAGFCFPSCISLFWPVKKWDFLGQMLPHNISLSLCLNEPLYTFCICFFCKNMRHLNHQTAKSPTHHTRQLHPYWSNMYIWVLKEIILRLDPIYNLSLFLMSEISIHLYQDLKYQIIMCCENKNVFLPLRGLSDFLYL